MSRSRHIGAGLACLALSLIGGCFSGDDFSACTEVGQCGLDGDGLALMCLDGACVRPPVEGRETVTLSGPLGSQHTHTERLVRIEAVTLNESVLRVDADAIVVAAQIRGDGAGLSGGDGGAGGGSSGGGAGAAGSQGLPSRSETAGGGLGGHGGADEGDGGGAGAGGRHPADEPCQVAFDRVEPGSGGGGGGGGGGAGGCSGADGGRGGAAIVLRARRFIEIQAPLQATGQPGDAARIVDCAGAGGAGGGGSGGVIYLEAPVILFSDGARLDVRGAEDAGGGLVTVYGAIEGAFPGVHGAKEAGVCLR